MTRLLGRRAKTPTLLQMEAVECGAAALGIILGHYGRHVPLEELRAACNVSRDGTNARNIVLAARAYGMTAQGIKTDIAGLKNIQVPFIAYWNFDHFIVVEGFCRSGFYVNDPAYGPVTVDADRFDRSFTGVVLSIEPKPEFRGGGRPDGVAAPLLRVALMAAGPFIFVVLASLALVVPQLLIPTLTRVYVDQFLVQHLSDWVRPLVIAMLGAGLIVGALTWLQQFALARLQAKLTIVGARQFFGHLLTLPIDFYLQRSAGALASRVALNDRIAQLVADDLGTTACELLTAIFVAGLMWRYDRLLTCIVLGSAALNFVALRWAARWRIDGKRRLLRDREKVAGVSTSGLQIIEALKASGQESEFFARWFGHEANLLNSEQRLAFATRLLSSLPPLLTALSFAGVLGIGAMHVIAGKITIGMLIAFQGLMWFFLAPISRLVELGGTLQEVEGDLSRLHDVLKLTPDQRATKTNLSADDALDPARQAVPLAGQLELKEVSFGYNQLAPPLLQSVSFSARPGARVAIVGATGSGKSSIARLVAGLYAVSSGQILLDGRDAKDVAPPVLRRSVAMVDQDIVLFEGTVRDNLTLWNTEIHLDQLVCAATDAAIHDEILRRPLGYDAAVAEGGANFSGGQRQQLEIARALVANPSILILDEATSALDAVTEATIETNLRRRGCTFLIIAHRLSTVRDSDEIIVMEQGRIVQRGTHDQLRLVDNGPYARLLRNSPTESAEFATVGRDSAVIAPDTVSLPAPNRLDCESTESNGERTRALTAACRAVADSRGMSVLTVPRIEASARSSGDQVHSQIMRIAAANRFRCRRVELYRNWWRGNHGPLLAFVDNDRRPVALLPSSGRAYQMVDGKTGDTLPVNGKNARGLGRHGYSFTKPFPPRAMNAWEFLLLSAEGCRSDLIRILWSAGAAGALTMAVPVASAFIFDTVIPEADHSALLQLTILLLGIAICGAMFRLTSSVAALRVQAKMEATSQAGVWDRLLSLRPSFFRSYAVGDLADRAMGMNQMRVVLTESMLSAMFAAIFSIFSFALLFFYSTKLAMIVLAAAIISAITIAWAGWLEIRYQRALSDATGKTNSLVLQLLNGIAKLRIAGAENRAFTVWCRRFAEQQRLALASRQIVARLIAFQSSFSIIVIAFILAATTALVAPSASGRRGTPVLATGQFLAFLTAASTFLSATAAVSSALVKGIRVIPLYERARPLLQALPESDATKLDPGRLSGQIEFVDVTFRYGDGPSIIKGASFTIAPGEFVAIVGPSGSGKSTLLRLLLGFEQPSQGSIRYDGRDLARLDALSVRKQLGVVLQSGGLFPGSIFMNIAASLPLTMEDAWEAARLAGIDQAVRQMPMGMFTYVSDAGTALSGGQRQQLLVARALASRPRIFLLDEATSALDNVTQSRVIRSLEAVSATRIVIAHRLTTVRNADRILVMDRGSIVQQGTYQQLSSLPGVFGKLAQRQAY